MPKLYFPKIGNRSNVLFKAMSKQAKFVPIEKAERIANEFPTNH